MKYLHAMKGSSVAFILFIIAVVFIPVRESTEDVKIILTVSTFLFAILAGFFISRTNNRYDRIRELVSTEDGLWISIYKTAGFFGTQIQTKIGEIINNHHIAAFDYDVGKYYKATDRYFYSIYDLLIENKSTIRKNASDLLDDMVGLLNKMGEFRNKSSVIASEKLTKGQWGIMLFLSGLILFSLFALKTDAFYSQISTVLLSTILVLVLLILRDLQNLNIAGQLAVTESGQEVFEAMGKLRYYPEIQIKEGLIKVPKSVKRYRLGLHKPGEKANIKIVKQ